MELNGCPPVLMNFEHQHDRDAVLAKSSSLDKQSGIVVNIICTTSYYVCMNQEKSIGTAKLSLVLICQYVCQSFLFVQ